ncbi:MAG: hypothetical protein PVI81_10255 [Anaerolineales bacterium]
MNWKRLAYWAPRVISIVVILFTSIFALDVFGEGESFLRTLMALLIHLLPQIALAIALTIAWRRPGIGGALFLLLSLFSFLLFGLPLSLPAHLILTYPIILSGILFLVEWRFGSHHQATI